MKKITVEISGKKVRAVKTKVNSWVIYAQDEKTKRWSYLTEIPEV